MRLLITRHGETVWNIEGRLQGQQDSPLTARGEAQARQLAARLRHEPIDVVYASDSRRAWRTAEIALGERALPVLQDPAWRETGYGAWEGLTRDEIKRRFAQEWKARNSNRASVAPPGGETLLEVRKRVATAAQQLRQRHIGQTVLVVTHAGSLLQLRNWMTGEDAAAGLDAPALNCSLSCIHWHDESPLVEYWFDAAHLQEESA